MLTAGRTPVPPAKAVGDLLCTLLDREARVRMCPAWVPRAGEGAAFAVYVDDRLGTRAVAVADLALSAYAAAAVGLVPPETARQAIGAGLLPRPLEENLHEVFNVCSSLLNGPGLAHVRLYDVFCPGGSPPPDLRARVMARVRRLDLDVDISGYGGGRLAFVAAG